MLNLDFTKYSLVLINNNQIVFSSNKHSLRPLIECMNKYKDKLRDCLLYDKVVGLAAARIVIYSNIISEIIAEVVSTQAVELLGKNKITLQTKKIVDDILNNDKSSICPWELNAKEINNNEKFFLEIDKVFSQ